MKSKKIFLPTLIIAVAILVIATFSVIISIAKKPTVTEYEFPFSITYESDGETVVISDVYKVRYVRNDGYADTKSRVYVGEIGDRGEDNTIYTLKKDENTRVELWTNFHPDYLMGDSEGDYFDDEPFEPQILYYDAEEIEYCDDETLAAQGVRLISFEYPTPIENSFVFSHISIFSNEVVLPSLLFAFLALIVILKMVEKDETIVPKNIDGFSKMLNFIIAFTLLPFFTLCGWILDITGDNAHIVNQILYFIPALTVLGIAASVALRRNGYSKSALAVELVGPGIFGVILLICAFLGLL